MPRDQRWPLWFALPIQPGERRVTQMTEVVPGRIYAFEQLQGVLDVIVNIRMTVVVLSGPDGGLFVHSPVAPTDECVRLMRELEGRHGPVRHIVLPTTAVEHKIFVGPFAKRFPDAEVYVAPRQWSFPLNLPIGFLGLFPRRANVLSTDGGGDEPWRSEFDCAVLNLTVGIGPFVECAFFHKPTRTLLVTDCVFKIPRDPPEVCCVDPAPLLFRARDDDADEIEDTDEGRRVGWLKVRRTRSTRSCVARHPPHPHPPCTPSRCPLPLPPSPAPFSFPPPGHRIRTHLTRSLVALPWLRSDGAVCALLSALLCGL